LPKKASRRDRLAVLDGEVMLVEVVEVEGAGGVWRVGGEEADAADGDGEVRRHVHAGFEALDEDGQRHVFPVAGDEAVVG